MPSIPLSRGQVARVSSRDLEGLSVYSWFALLAKDRWYAARKESGKMILMHRQIMMASPLQKVDHRDSDGLNNVRGNLRFCTLSENCANSVRGAANRSGYKGVSWKAQCGKWQVSVQKDYVNRYVGLFSDVIKAAHAYDRAARAAFGEFARTNF